MLHKYLIFTSNNNTCGIISKMNKQRSLILIKFFILPSINRFALRFTLFETGTLYNSIFLFIAMGFEPTTTQFLKEHSTIQPNGQYCGISSAYINLFQKQSTQFLYQNKVGSLSFPMILISFCIKNGNRKNCNFKKVCRNTTFYP